jgi:hypothetical protein
MVLFILVARSNCPNLSNVPPHVESHVWVKFAKSFSRLASTTHGFWRTKLPNTKNPTEIVNLSKETDFWVHEHTVAEASRPWPQPCSWRIRHRNATDDWDNDGDGGFSDADSDAEYGPAMMMIRMCYRVSISTDLISMAATIAGRATNRSSPPALVLANTPRSNVHSANTSINYANYFSTASAEERLRPKGSQLANRPPSIIIPGSSSRRTSSNHCTNTSTNYTLPIDL